MQVLLGQRTHGYGRQTVGSPPGAHQPAQFQVHLSDGRGTCSQICEVFVEQWVWQDLIMFEGFELPTFRWCQFIEGTSGVFSSFSDSENCGPGVMVPFLSHGGVLLAEDCLTMECTLRICTLGICVIPLRSLMLGPKKLLRETMPGEWCLTIQGHIV